MKIGCGRYSESQWQDHMLDTRSSSLTSHLRTCAACQKEMGDLQATVSAVKQTPLSHTAVRTSFVDRVLAEAGGNFTAAGAATAVPSGRSAQPISRPGRRSWKLRWPESWQGAVPIMAAACVAFLILWTGAGGLDFLFPVKEGTPITSSPVTFQVAADFDAHIQPFATMGMSTFAADLADSEMSPIAADPGDPEMSTFAADPSDPEISPIAADPSDPEMSPIAADPEIMSFAADASDPGPMANFRMMSFVEETVPLATPDGVTSAVIAEEQRGWSLGLGRIPDAEPIHQPAGITTNRPVANETP